MIKKYLYIQHVALCLALLAGLLFGAFYVSRALDNRIYDFAEVTDLIIEQKNILQRFAYVADLFKDYDNQNRTDIEFLELYDSYHYYYNFLQDNEKIIRAYYNGSPAIQDHTAEFYKVTSSNGKNRIENIRTILSMTGAIKDILRNILDEDAITGAQKQELIAFRLYIENIILPIAYESHRVYSVFGTKVRADVEKEKLAFILLFLTLICGVIAISFYPLSRRLTSSLKINQEQKKQFELERDRLLLSSKATETGVWDWDIETDHMYWNDVLKSILGENAEGNDFTSSYFFDELLHPSDLQDFKDILVEHIKNGKSFTHQCRVMHGGGKYIWAVIRGRVMRQGDGKAHRMAGSFVDITDQKNAELKNEIFLQGIRLANIPFAIIDWANDQRQFTYASPAMCDLTGYDENKILSSNMNMFTGPETSMAVLDKIDYALSEKKVLETKILNYRSDGTSFWNQIEVQPIFDKDNRFTENYIIIFNDLTKDMENQKKEIERQRKESLGALSGSVAHEINNLLMPMSMARDILEGELKDDCDPFAREQLQTIVDYAAQAKNIVNGILTFSRKETVQLHKANIHAEIESSIQFIRGLLARDTTLTYHAPTNEDKDIMVMINSTEMKQIITNLCQNAEQAFENGTGNIDIGYKKVKLSHEEKNDMDLMASDFIEISVADDGCGIPDKNLKKIFEPLFTTKAIGQGTGLGLSVVIGIIQSWGGNIKVDSILGQGTTFRMYIPIHKNEEDFSDLEELINSL